MNLHNIANAYVTAVNPNLPGVFRRSTGSTTSADGTRVPTYATGVPLVAQVQALQYKDLMQLDGLNINGEKRAMYVNGNWEGVSRPANKGGDIITLDGDGSVWLIVLVLENWASSAGWNKIAVVKQNGS